MSAYRHHRTLTQQPHWPRSGRPATLNATVPPTCRPRQLGLPGGRPDSTPDCRHEHEPGPHPAGKTRTLPKDWLHIVRRVDIPPPLAEPPFGAARPRIVQLVMAVHKEYPVRSWLRHRVSGTIGIRSRRRGGGLKAWLRGSVTTPAGSNWPSLTRSSSRLATPGVPGARPRSADSGPRSPSLVRAASGNRPGPAVRSAPRSPVRERVDRGPGGLLVPSGVAEPGERRPAGSAG